MKTIRSLALYTQMTIELGTRNLNVFIRTIFISCSLFYSRG